MRYKIAVMGKAGRSKDLQESLKKNAEIVGREIVRRGCILVTGACMGVPDIAAKAASKAGGLVLGYSPSKNLKDHIEPPISYPWPAENEELIFTGYDKLGRNVLSIFGSDGAIFIGGGAGTLNEFSAAYHEGKVIGILEGVGGILERVFEIEDELKKGTAKEVEVVIIKDRDPRKLVARVVEEIKKHCKVPRKEIPLTFKNEKGKNLSGVFHLPQKSKPPLVIMCHGFDGTKTDKKFVELGRALQREGIAAFRFDFEGCGDSEGDFSEMTVADEVADLNSALKAILKAGDLDSKRIALVGYSLGAVVVTLFLKKIKVPVKTLVFWSPGFNQTELFGIWHTQEEIEKWQEKGFLIKGDKKLGKNYLQENRNKDWSFLLSQIPEMPILLIHGKKDEDVPLRFSEELAKNYKNTKLKILPRAEHKLDDFYSRQKLVKLTVDWLKKYL